MDNTGKGGIGGIVRNEQGDFAMAFSVPAECFSNNHAELLAANFWD